MRSARSLVGWALPLLLLAGCGGGPAASPAEKAAAGKGLRVMSYVGREEKRDLRCTMGELLGVFRSDRTFGWKVQVSDGGGGKAVLRLDGTTQLTQVPVAWEITWEPDPQDPAFLLATRTVLDGKEQPKENFWSIISTWSGRVKR